MKLSTKGRYGSRAMLDLAAKYGHGPVMVKDIAVRQELSEKYLEQILSELRKAGMVISVQGKNGGFQLARAPEKITLLDILKVLEGGLAPVHCVEDESVCVRSGKCIMRDVWESLRKSSVKILGGLTLKDLLVKEQEKVTGKAVMDFSI